jgi:Fic family protein
LPQRRRTYEETHSWITFTHNLRAADRKVWLHLGEAQSKCEHIAGVPLTPDTARELHKVYLAKGAFATTSIEGNTLTEEEVRQRLEGRLQLPKSREYLGTEVDNILEACNEMLKDLRLERPLALTPERIKHFNKLVLRGLEVEEDVVPGEYRTHSVGVASYRGAPAEDIPYLVERLCEWLNGTSFVAPDPELQFAAAIFKAVIAHLYIAWIHPFGDGNGRTARLIEFQLLLQAGVPTPAGQLLSNHYNQTRDHYYRELDRASRSGGQVEGFVQYAIQGFVDGLREQLGYIRNQQWEVTWENYVHSLFHELGETAANRRRKHLVLDLPGQPIPRAQLRLVTPRVAQDYAGKGEKTLTRDINALIKLGLLVREGRAFRAHREIILAFLPLSL